MNAIRATLNVPFEQAVDHVKSVFQEHGFGTLSQIDVQCTLKEKIGEEVEPYTILGVCNPRLAYRAISAEHEIGMLLPCGVLIHQCGGAVHVAAQDPIELLSLSDSPDLQSVATEAHELIAAAISAM
jgi:uncharacterized protein (DUF302 family)